MVVKLKINFSNLLEKKLCSIKDEGKIPKLLLHSCCAPCSSQVLARLSDYFLVTILYYNPNIEPFSEYEKRKTYYKWKCIL